MMQSSDHFANNDPRLQDPDQQKSVTLKDYFMKRFQSSLPKPTSKSEPLEIEMKTFTKENPFVYKPEEEKEDKMINNPNNVQSTNKFSDGSNVTDFLDNLQELYKNLCLKKNQKAQFLNLLTYLYNLLTILETSPKNTVNKNTIQIVDSQFKEDNFIIMLLSLGYEMTFWSENKILLTLGTEPSREFISLASSTIRSQYLENQQFMSQPRPDPALMRQSQPVRAPVVQDQYQTRADFLASKHEQRLNQMNQPYGGQRSNMNTANNMNNQRMSASTNSMNSFRQNHTDASYMDSQRDEYRNMMRSQNVRPVTANNMNQAQYTDYRYQQQQPQQPPQQGQQYNSAYQSYPKPERSFEDDQILYGLTVLELTNQFRGNNRLPPVDWNQELCDIGMEHAKAMAEGKVPLGHQGYEKRLERIKFPRWSIAENVACNAQCQNPPDVAVRGWINSAAHRNNLLSKSNICGVACYRAANGTWYFTQIFAVKECIVVDKTLSCSLK